MDYNFNNIPAELKTLPHWVLWRGIRQPDGKIKKKPFSVKGGEAKVNRPETWATFDSAQAAQKNGRYDGVGFVFTGTPYIGVDLDGLEGGELTPLAKDVIARLDSYMELSPSGNGIHIIAKGYLPKGRRKTNQIEMYGDGSPRYFTMTGALYGEFKPIRSCQEAIDALHAEYIQPVGAQPDKRPLPQGNSILLDEEVIEKARQGKNGEVFQALWGGDLSAHGGDHSGGDLALCNTLAFYCGRDIGQMDRLFRESGLMRSKWDEVHGAETYGDMTLKKAARECREIYNPTEYKRDKVLESFSSGSLKFTRMSEIEREKAEYLFFPYIPKGKLTIIAGVSGSTKTWMCLYLASIIAGGGKFITDDEGGIKRLPAPVLYQTKENDYAVDIRYRLDALGANLDNIIMLNDHDEDGKGQPLTLSDPRLKQAIEEHGIQMLILDPIQSYLGAGVDMHRANEVRPILDRLIEVAADTGCAIVLVSHLNKDSNMAALDRILGSSDLRNAARSIVFIGGAPENPQQRVLAHAKNSLGPNGKSIAYHIDDQVHGVVIDGFTDFDEDDITKPRQRGTRDKPSKTLEEVKDLLLALLTETGYADLDDIHMAMDGVSEKTLYRAKKALGVESMSTGFGFDKRSWWYMGLDQTTLRQLIAGKEMASS